MVLTAAHRGMAILPFAARSYVQCSGDNLEMKFFSKKEIQTIAEFKCESDNGWLLSSTTSQTKRTCARNAAKRGGRTRPTVWTGRKEDGMCTLLSLASFVKKYVVCKNKDAFICERRAQHNPQMHVPTMKPSSPPLLSAAVDTVNGKRADMILGGIGKHSNLH